MTNDDAIAVTRKPHIVTSPRTAVFWEAANEGRLLLQRCQACGHVQHYARSICTACWSNALVWQDSAGLGTVWTFTVICMPGHPAWRADVPYVVAVIELDEGPRILTNLVDCDPSSVSIGQRVRLRPTWQADTGQTLVTFRPDVPDDRTEQAANGSTGSEGSR